MDKNGNDFMLKQKDGSAMKFYLGLKARTSLEGLEVSNFIDKHGGIVLKSRSNSCIELVLPEDKEAIIRVARPGKVVYLTTFLKDCSEAGKLLDMEPYALKTADTSPSRSHTYFSAEDDSLILSYVKRAAGSGPSINGDKFWQESALKLNTKHSWQSLKNRFKKHLAAQYERPKIDGQRRSKRVAASIPLSIDPVEKRQEQEHIVGPDGTVGEGVDTLASYSPPVEGKGKNSSVAAPLAPTPGRAATVSEKQAEMPQTQEDASPIPGNVSVNPSGIHSEAVSAERKSEQNVQNENNFLSPSMTWEFNTASGENTKKLDSVQMQMDGKLEGVKEISRMDEIMTGIKHLEELTGASKEEVLNSLVESSGDFKVAAEILQGRLNCAINLWSKEDDDLLLSELDQWVTSSQLLMYSKPCLALAEKFGASSVRKRLYFLTGSGV